MHYKNTLGTSFDWADFNNEYWINWVVDTPITFTTNFIMEKIDYKDNSLEIKLNVAGVKKEDLELIVEKDILKVSFEGTTDFVGSFNKEYNIEGYNGKRAKISLVDGVLEIVMDRKDSYKPKKLKF